MCKFTAVWFDRNHDGSMNVGVCVSVRGGSLSEMTYFPDGTLEVGFEG